MPRIAHVVSPNTLIPRIEDQRSKLGVSKQTSRGGFMFGLRTKLVLLGGAAVLALQYSSDAWAQTKVADASETVIVTGTRGKERTVTSSATPIDVLKGEAIEQAGQGSVLAALDTLIPSFVEPAIPGGSTATI